MAQPTSPTTAAPAAVAFVPRLVESSFALEGDYRIRFSVDLKLDITDPTLDTTWPIKGVPLPGKWSLHVHRDAPDADVKFHIYHGSLQQGELGTPYSSLQAKSLEPPHLSSPRLPPRPVELLSICLSLFQYPRNVQYPRRSPLFFSASARARERESTE